MAFADNYLIDSIYLDYALGMFIAVDHIHIIIKCIFLGIFGSEYNTMMTTQSIIDDT